MEKKEQLVEQLGDLYHKIAWFNGLSMKNQFDNLKSSEVHVIEYIGSHENPNVTQLAEAFYQTRGGISKLMKKLVSKGIIESYQKPDNKKEVFFRLTPQGNTVYRKHEKLHAEFEKRDAPVFEKISNEQFDFMLEFIDDYNKHLDAEIAKTHPTSL